MITLTAAQFKDLEFSKIDVEVVDSVFERHDDYDGSFIFESWSAGDCILSAENVSISFCWQASGGQKSYEEAHNFDVSLHHDDAQIKMTGAVLVDDDGDEMRGSHAEDMFLKEFLTGGEWESRVLAEMPRAEEEKIDGGEGGEEFLVYRTDAPDLRFFGEHVAHAASSDNKAMWSSYSGTVGRWTVLDLYKTSSGKFVCARAEKTRWQGEMNRFYADVCSTESEIIDFFGHDWLAKELYDDAKIDAVESVQ